MNFLNTNFSDKLFAGETEEYKVKNLYNNFTFSNDCEKITYNSDDFFNYNYVDLKFSESGETFLLADCKINLEPFRIASKLTSYNGKKNLTTDNCVVVNKNHLEHYRKNNIPTFLIFNIDNRNKHNGIYFINVKDLNKNNCYPFTTNSGIEKINIPCDFNPNNKVSSYEELFEKINSYRKILS